MKRLGPMWLRDLSSDSLHGLGTKLVRLHRTEGLSPRQDWLLERICHELGWRMSKRPPRDRCTCLLCLDPWLSYWSPDGSSGS